MQSMKSAQHISPSAQFVAEHDIKVTNDKHSSGGKIGESFAAMLTDEIQQWRSINERLAGTQKHLSVEQRALLESQLVVQQISVRTHLSSQIAEAATSSLKKLQQFGS